MEVEGGMKLTRKNGRLIFTRMNARKTSAPDVGRFGGYIPKGHTRYCVYVAGAAELTSSSYSYSYLLGK